MDQKESGGAPQGFWPEHLERKWPLTEMPEGTVSGMFSCMPTLPELERREWMFGGGCPQCTCKSPWEVSLSFVFLSPLTSDLGLSRALHGFPP